MQRDELQKLKVFAFGLKKPSIKQTTCRLWNPQWYLTEDMDSLQICGEIEDVHPTWIYLNGYLRKMQHHLDALNSMAQQVTASASVCSDPSDARKHLETALLLGVLDRWKSMAAAELFSGSGSAPPLVRARKGCTVAGRRGHGEGSWLCNFVQHLEFKDMGKVHWFGNLTVNGGWEADLSPSWLVMACIVL